MSGYLGRPGATAAAVVGQPDEHWGEIVVAFVTAAPGAVVEQESLRSFCRERLAAYKVPAVVTVIDAMPLNASGKILKRAQGPDGITRLIRVARWIRVL